MRPHSGTVQDASEGRLEIPSAAMLEFVDRLQPLLARLGTVMRCGPVGSGVATAALISYSAMARRPRPKMVSPYAVCGLSDI